MSEQDQANSIREPSRETPVRTNVDVLIVGGGLGGVAATLAAARAGVDTLLVERSNCIGGVATSGMCCSIFNCYHTSQGLLGTTGIAVEIADRFAETAGYGPRWHAHKGHIIYDIEDAKRILADMLDDAGARVMLGTLAANTVMDGNQLQGIIVESKSGREAILARTVVDATGDADIAALAGAPVRRWEQGRHSLCFRMGNVDIDAFVQYFRDRPDQYPAYMDVDWSAAEAIQQYDDCGTFLFPHGGGMQMETLQQAKAEGMLPESVGIQDTIDACQMHALRRTGIVHVITGFTSFDGLDVDTISRSIVDGRTMASIVCNAFRHYVPGFANAFIAGTADALGVRVSRSIDGEFVFTRDMMAAGNRFPDAVGRAVGFGHQVKHPGERAWSAQLCHSDSFDIPYDCLLPRTVEGLVMGAGRSVSAESPWLLRVMAHTMAVGQGAGTAAAVAARCRVSPRKVDLDQVQDELRNQDVEL